MVCRTVLALRRSRWLSSPPVARRALALVGLSSFDDAAACLDQAITLDGHVADLFVVRAKVRWAMGLEQQGNADIRRAHALEPAHPEVRPPSSALHVA